MPVLTPRVSNPLSSYNIPDLSAVSAGLKTDTGIIVSRYESGVPSGSFGVSLGFQQNISGMTSLTASNKALLASNLIAACSSPSSQLCVSPAVCKNSSTVSYKVACSDGSCTTSGSPGSWNGGIGYTPNVQISCMVGVQSGFEQDSYATCLLESLNTVAQQTAEQLQNGTGTATTSVSASSASVTAQSKSSARGCATSPKTALVAAMLVVATFVLKNA